MLKQLTTTAALIAFTLPAFAQDGGMTPVAEMPAGIYKNDPSHTSLTFKVSHAGLSHYTARFTSVEADLNFDPADVTKSSLSVTVDPASIRTDYPYADKKDFDKELGTGADWFNAGEYPNVTFTSTAIEKTGDTTGKVTGDLTLLGVTKPVTLDITFNGAYKSKPFANVPALGFSATGVMKRSDWGLDTYVPMIGDEVTLLIETELEQK
jgi:polyisoprenoid-binding protein YceI